MPDSPTLVFLEATVHGKVTGVNFRANTCTHARHLCVTGWVRNNPDGTVGVLAHGTRAALDALLEFLHVGLPPAVVTRVNVDWHQRVNSFTDFNIHW